MEDSVGCTFEEVPTHTRIRKVLLRQPEPFSFAVGPFVRYFDVLSFLKKRLSVVRCLCLSSSKPSHAHWPLFPRPLLRALLSLWVMVSRCLLSLQWIGHGGAVSPRKDRKVLSDPTVLQFCSAVHCCSCPCLMLFPLGAVCLVVGLKIHGQHKGFFAWGLRTVVPVLNLQTNPFFLACVWYFPPAIPTRMCASTAVGWGSLPGQTTHLQGCTKGNRTLEGSH